MLFDSGNVQQLSARLRELVDDPQQRERLSSAATQFVATHLTMATSIQRMTEIYQSFLH